MAETLKFYSGDRCAAIVKSAVPGLSQEQLDSVADAFEVHLKYAEPGNEAQAAKDAVEQIVGKLRHNNAARKYQKFLNLKKSKENYHYVSTSFTEDMYKGIEARIFGVNSDRRGSRLAAEVSQDELLGKYYSGLLGDLENEGLLKKLSPSHFLGRFSTDDVEFQRRVAIEMRRIGQEDIIAPTGDNEALTAAQIFHRHQEIARIDANDAGADIGEISGYITRQSHDMYRVREMGFDAWKELINDKLDWKKMELEGGKLIDDREKFLRITYDNIISGNYMKVSDVVPASTVAGSAANMLSHERVLHFKDDEWFNYNLQAGTSDVFSAVVRSLKYSADRTGLMRTWGPSAVSNFKNVMKDLEKKFPDQADARSRFLMEKYMENVSRANALPGTNLASKVAVWAKTLQNLLKLGTAQVTAGLTDPMIIASELKYQGGSWFDSVVKSFGSEFSRGNIEQARALQVYAHSQIHEFNSRYASMGSMGGTASKINQLYFKMNLMTQETDNVRHGAAALMSSLAASHADKEFSQLPKEYSRVLGFYDIGEKEWGLMRKHGVENFDEHSLMTPEAISRIPDNDVRASLGADMTDRQVRLAKEELRTKFHSYLADRVNSGVLRPGGKTQTITSLGTTPGTNANALITTLMHFKSFPIEFLNRVVGREVSGHGASTRGQVALRLGNLIVQSAFFGYAVIATKNLLQGKEIPGFNKDTVKRSFLVGGGLGIYGDILFGEWRKGWGHGFSSTFLGPSAGTVDNLADVMGKWVDGDVKAGRDFKELYRTFAPNLFYLRPVLDYAILYNMMDRLEPGSVSRMQRRYEKENDVKYFDFASPSKAVQ